MAIRPLRREILGKRVLRGVPRAAVYDAFKRGSRAVSLKESYLLLETSSKAASTFDLQCKPPKIATMARV